mgnify:CR=1 FL=1
MLWSVDTMLDGRNEENMAYAQARSIILEVKGLEVSYPTERGPISPLMDFSLTIHEREVVGLVGDAGSAKSTAALAMMGRVRAPGRIEAGEVLFAGNILK